MIDIFRRVLARLKQICLRVRRSRNLPDEPLNPHGDILFAVNETVPSAHRAVSGEYAPQVLTFTLAGQLNEPELRDAEHPSLQPVVAQFPAEIRQKLLPVLLVLHVYEVNYHNPAD